MVALKGHDIRSKATELGQHYPTFTKWCNGSATPGIPRRKFFQKNFNIPIGAWDEELEPATPPPAEVSPEEPAPITQRFGTLPKPARDSGVRLTPPSPSPGPPAPALIPDELALDDQTPDSGVTFQFMDRPAKRQLESQMARLQSMIDGKDLSGPQQIQAINTMSRLTRQMAELSGELKPTEIRRLMGTMEFREVFSTIAGILKRRCPEVIPEVVEALGLLDSEKQRNVEADKAA